MPLMLLSPRRKHRRNNRGRVDDNAPPVPPAELRVSAVTLVVEVPTNVLWEFSMDIADPANANGLIVNSQPGVSWSRNSPNSIYVEYAAPESQGVAWNALAGAVESTDGVELVAETGWVA